MEEHCLRLLKNSHDTKDAAVNWHAAFQKALENRGSYQDATYPCLFTRKDCVVITHIEDYLTFYKNKKGLEDFLESLKR